MYIESSPGSSGFPDAARGMGWKGHMQSGGPGAEMQIRGAEGVEIMGPPAPGGAPGPLVVAPPTVAMPVSQHSDTAMYVAGGVMVLGLAYVLYKVVKS